MSDMQLLAQQLGQLGVDLQDEVSELGRLEQECVEAEGSYRDLDNKHEDAIATAFLRATGTNAEARKAESRLKSIESRAVAEVAWKAWQKLRADVRVQQESIRALHRRIEIGRSLLSREKALISLGEM